MDSRPTSNISPSQIPVPPPTSNRAFPWLVISIILFIFAIITLAYSFIIQKQSTTPLDLSPTPAKAPPPKISFVYVKDKDLFLYHEGQSKQLTQTNGLVTAYAYSPDSRLLAYVKGFDYNTKPYPPTSVHLLDTDSGISSKLLEIDTLWTEGTEYIRALRDVEFSPDAKLLAITSSDSMWTYDIGTQKLDPVFNTPVKDVKIKGIFSYLDPMISPDGKMAIITKGYYEGASQSLINLTTKSITDLPGINFYVAGKRILAWRSSSQLLTLEYSDATSSYDSVFTLSTAPLPSLAPSTTIYSSPGQVSQWDIAENQMVLLTGTSKLSGKFAGPENDIPLYDQFMNISLLDLSSGDLKNLLTLPNNNEIGNISPADIKLLKGKILVATHKRMGEGATPSLLEIYLLDPASENPQLELLTTGSFNTN